MQTRARRAATGAAQHGFNASAARRHAPAVGTVGRPRPVLAWVVCLGLAAGCSGAAKNVAPSAGPRLAPSTIPVVAACRGLVLNAAGSEALLTCQMAVRQFPEEPSAHFLYGVSLLQNGESQAALDAFKRAQGRPEIVALAGYYSGLAFALLGDPAGAKAAFAAAVQAFPDYAEARAALGDLAREADLPAEAEAHYRKTLAGQPGHPGATRGLAWVLATAGRYDEAAAVIEAHLQRVPDDPDAVELLAGVRLRQGRPGDTVTLLDPRAEAGALPPAARLDLATALAAMGELARAADVAAGAELADVRDDRDRFALPELGLRLGIYRYRLAFERLAADEQAWAVAKERAARAGATPPPPPRLDLRSAEAAYARFKVDYPRQTNGAAALTLGAALAEAAGRGNEAEALYGQVLTADREGPYAAAAALGIGRLKEARGDMGGAVTSYTRALLLPAGPWRDRARYALALGRYRLGDSREALNVLVQLVEEPATPEAGAEAVRSAALELTAAILHDDDWDGDGQADADAGPGRIRAAVAAFGEHGPALLQRLGMTPETPAPSELRAPPDATPRAAVPPAETESQ